MKRTAQDDHANRQQRADPQENRDPTNLCNAPVKQEDDQDAHARHQQPAAVGAQPGPQVAGVLRKTDIAGGDLERTTQQELPDEKK